MNIFRIKQLSQYIHSESRNYENYMKDLKTIREKDSNEVERVSEIAGDLCLIV